MKTREDWIPPLVLTVCVLFILSRCEKARAADYHMDLAITRQIEHMAPADIHALAGAQANPSPERVPCFQVRRYDSPTGPTLMCITEAEWRRQHAED